jgi:hypothetical protein
MHLPRLQQPIPGQRHRPPSSLAPRRHHRDQQPGPTLPQTPPPQTQQRLETHTSHPKRTTRLDLTHRPTLQNRTTRPGTTTMATRLSAQRRKTWPPPRRPGNTRTPDRGRTTHGQASRKEPIGRCACGPANRLTYTPPERSVSAGKVYFHEPTDDSRFEQRLPGRGRPGLHLARSQREGAAMPGTNDARFATTLAAG